MTKEAPLPYFKWFWQDWRSNRTVQRMTYIERGLYRELLDECWVEGSIPADIESLADICGCPVDVMANAWQVLGKCFRLLEGRYHNEKLDSLRTERDAVRVKRKDAGRLGGIRKALNQNESVANAKQALEVASVCHIEEKRREEKENPPNPPDGGNLLSSGKPEKPKRKARAKSEAVLLADWLSDCKAKGEPAIKPDDPIRSWADDAGIPDDYMRLAWQVFLDRYRTAKPQKDWPAHFRNAIRGNWLKLWYIDADGDCRLTTAGLQEQKVHGHG